jgi:hypothetical protein
VPDGFGDAAIPLLRPWDTPRRTVSVVPGYDPNDDPAWRDRWFRWREAILPVRESIRTTCERDPGARREMLAMCGEDYKFWLTVWGMVYEPRVRRNRATGLIESKHKPFTPFAFQCHVADWFRRLAEMEEGYDGYITKSRGVGVSWTIVGFSVWGWRWHDMTTLLMSRTQSEVDKPNNINTLFGKAMYFLRRQPAWMLPEGFSLDEHRTQLNIHNPETDAQIYGETSTGFAGVGDRATLAFIDEAAKLRDLQDIERTLTGTADHVIANSTEDISLGFTWDRKWKTRHAADPEGVFILDYFVNPYNDEAWLEATRQRFADKNDLAGFEREVMRNPRAGYEGIVYPEAELIRWADAEHSDYDPALPVFGSIDPGWNDDTAIVWAQPLDGALFGKGPLRFIQTYERNLVPAEWYAHILTGVEPEPGDACYDIWRRTASPRDKQILQWCAQLPWHDRCRYFMDPAGIQGNMGGKSFYERLITESKRLRQRLVDRGEADGRAARRIAPLYKELFPARQHQPRQNAARAVLARSEFVKNPGVNRLVEALQSYRWTELTPKATSEPKPIHDEHSHLVAAFEYLAVYADRGYARVPNRNDDEASDGQSGGTLTMVA